MLERLLRGRARYHGALARGEAVVPRRLRGLPAALAVALPALLLALVLVGPVVQLAVWSVESLGEGATGGDLARDTLRSMTAGRRGRADRRRHRDGHRLRAPDAARPSWGR